MKEVLEHPFSSITSNNKTSFREIRLILFLMSIALIILVPSFYNPKITNVSTSFVFTNLLIGAISIIMIVVEARRLRYSLHSIHWIFQFSFFFIAPLMQYLNNSFIWGLLTSHNIELLLKSNLLIILWQGIWILTAANTSRRHVTMDLIEKPLPNINISPFRFFILFALNFAALFFFIYSFGISGLLARGADTSNTLITNGSLMQIVYNVGKSSPVVLLICSYYKYKTGVNKNFWILTMAAASVMVLFLNFPTAISRFWAAAVYIGIILTFFKIRSKNRLIYMLIFGLFIVFPVLGMARYARNFSEFIDLLKINGLNSKNILTGDYDAYSMINYTVQFVELGGATYGKQLLGVLFFFVPRTFWESKPVGSGATVSKELGLSFDNISSPLIAEGLINFGIVGVIIFAILFSYLTRKFDLLFWYNPQGSAVLKSLYPFIIGLFFFMMRGDLLSTFSLMVSFSFAFFVFLRNPKQKKNKGR